jgi:hypothetical protein
MAAVINDSLIHMMIEAPENVNHRTETSQQTVLNFVYRQENSDLPLFITDPWVVVSFLWSVNPASFASG